MLGVFVGMATGFTMTMQQNLFLQRVDPFFFPTYQTIEILILSIICAQMVYFYYFSNFPPNIISNLAIKGIIGNSNEICQKNRFRNWFSFPMELRVAESQNNRLVATLSTIFMLGALGTLAISQLLCAGCHFFYFCGKSASKIVSLQVGTWTWPRYFYIFHNLIFSRYREWLA